MDGFTHFADALRRIDPAPEAAPLPESLLLRRESELSIYYAPFDHINRSARVCLCGITPGRQQAWLAINTAAALLRSGASPEAALQAAKESASFGGPMRRNLIDLLDGIGLNRLLDLGSCSELFSSARGLVHYTSALRYPVFVSGRNYSGSPDMLRVPFLREQIESLLAEELRALPKECVHIPLGPKASAALTHLVHAGKLDPSRVLHGLPHPSGANAERISYFLGRKSKQALSPKTNPAAIDSARADLRNKVEALLAPMTI